MRISRCVCEGFSGVDSERYQEMCEIVQSCESLKIKPPSEALEYIDKHNNGSEDSTVSLRPMIDKGVSLKTYDDRSAIIINLNEIDDNIDFIRIFHEEFEE